MDQPPIKEASGNLLYKMGTKGVSSSVRMGDQEGPVPVGETPNSKAKAGNKIWVVPPHVKQSKVVPHEIRKKIGRYT